MRHDVRTILISGFAGGARHWTPNSWPEGLPYGKQAPCQFIKYLKSNEFWKSAVKRRQDAGKGDANFFALRTK